MQRKDDLDYRECYELPDGLIASLSPSELSDLLRESYPQYHKDDGEIDYKKLKIALRNGDTKAKELFKMLFAMPEKLQYGAETKLRNSLEKIERTYGDKILAHGVEESKGGMCNLLMMSVSNCVRIPTAYWGCFRNGMPNISPLSHGPYYVIATTDAKNFRRLKSNMELDQVELILVPFEENKKIVEEKSKKMLSLDLITEEQHKVFCEKLFTYEDFLKLLQAKYGEQPEQTDDVSTEIVFSNSPVKTDVANEEEEEKEVEKRDDILNLPPAPSRRMRQRGRQLFDNFEVAFALQQPAHEDKQSAQISSELFLQKETLQDSPKKTTKRKRIPQSLLFGENLTIEKTSTKKEESDKEEKRPRRIFFGKDEEVRTSNQDTSTKLDDEKKQSSQFN